MLLFDFSDPSSDLHEKEIKRQTLQDILEYISMTRGVLTDMTVYPEIIQMVAFLLFLLY
jgi:serine/threonine-protein phosphatase 2A regulatory subunit B'